MASSEMGPAWASKEGDTGGTPASPQSQPCNQSGYVFVGLHRALSLYKYENNCFKKISLTRDPGEQGP